MRVRAEDVGHERCSPGVVASREPNDGEVLELAAYRIPCCAQKATKRSVSFVASRRITGCQLASGGTVGAVTARTKPS
jgi:hypothetical protein